MFGETSEYEDEDSASTNSMTVRLIKVHLQNPMLPCLRKFSLEREGLLLRLSLVGGMFDSVCHPSNCDAWALLFFQLMLYGVVSRERDR